MYVCVFWVNAVAGFGSWSCRTGGVMARDGLAKVGVTAVHVRSQKSSGETWPRTEHQQQQQQQQ